LISAETECLDEDLERLKLDFKEVEARLVDAVLELNKDKKLVLIS
jgi:hypothetical protein